MSLNSTRQDDLPIRGALSRKGGDLSDVAVVGGSAAGLFAASLLARNGVRVRVFERERTLNPAERTLIVTHRMRGLLGAAADRCVRNEIRRFELFTDGRSAVVDLDQPDLIIERRVLIESLAAEASQAGAAIEFGCNFRGLQSYDGAIKLDFERADGVKDAARSTTVVAADGAHSPVARAAGWPGLQTVPLIQAIVRLPADLSPNVARVWFAPDETPYFYWLIPESRERGALGVIGENGAAMRRHFERFLERRKLDPIEFQGARIPLYTGWVPVRRRFGASSVYLVGDAAAHVKVTTVGGIVTGLRGALGVAQSILHRRISPELRRLRRELNAHLWLRRSLHGFGQSDYSRLVDLLGSSALASLRTSSRDGALRLLCGVCVHQPRLLILGLRGFLLRRSGLHTARPGKD